MVKVTAWGKLKENLLNFLFVCLQVFLNNIKLDKWKKHLGMYNSCLLVETKSM